MVDVCLILEGTYPYVSGGVSTWVHALIRQLPDVEFGLIHLGAHPNDKQEYKYSLPLNVRFLNDLYLHDFRSIRKKPIWFSRREFSAEEQRMVQGCSHWNYSYFKQHFLEFFTDEKVLPSLAEVAYGHRTWKHILQSYRNDAHEQSFMDYFWTWRFTNLPVYQLFLHDIPPARLYHTVSTGYAGLLATIAKLRHDSSLLLTEHGIYTKERKIEVQSADWIYESQAMLELHENRHWFRQWWVNMFSFLAQVCYDHSDQIVTLFEGNREVQHIHGANPKHTTVVPNGILLSHYKESRELVRQRRMAQINSGPDVEDKVHIGFVGRIVPIKDVKTLLRAFQLVVQEEPHVHLYLLGPEDEDPEYYKECLRLGQILEIQDHLTYTGRVSLADWWPRLDFQVLSSISEGQPLVLLEGAAATIPAVTTDVGACRELIEGGTRKGDRDIGPMGFVVPLARPEKLAEAMLEMVRNPKLRSEMGERGYERVEEYYRQEDLLSRYATLYRELQVEI
jgi:glycosyltransferase involved in cell wall biosynthesis